MVVNVSPTISAPRGDLTLPRYRWQLEAFVDQVKGRTPQTWVAPEDSIANMNVIDDVYDAVSTYL